MSTPRRRRIGEQLSLARPLEANEPEGRLIHGLANREDAVILEDRGLSISEGGSDPSSLFLVYHDTPEVSIDAVRLVKPAGILRQHFKLAPKSRESLPVYAMRMTCCRHVGTRLVDLRMDREGGAVDGLVALYDDTVLVAQDKVGYLDQREVH